MTSLVLTANPDSSTGHAALRELLETKAHELFADYGLTCRILDAGRPNDLRLCGILGFTGHDVSGSIVLAASNEALATSNPSGSGADPAWSAELANQLVGRFKNALLRHGVELSISVPVVLKNLRLRSVTQPPIAPIHLGIGDGVATLWLELDGDVSLTAAPSDDPPLDEGEVMMF